MKDFSTRNASSSAGPALISGGSVWARMLSIMAVIRADLVPPNTSTASRGSSAGSSTPARIASSMSWLT